MAKNKTESTPPDAEDRTVKVTDKGRAFLSELRESKTEEDKQNVRDRHNTEDPGIPPKSK